MKICIIGNANSVHIQRWVHGLAVQSIEVILISTKSHGCIPNLRLLTPRSPRVKFFLLRYIFALLDAKKLKSMLRQINPDIIHMHYLRAELWYVLALRKQKNLFVSVWGSDILDDINNRVANLGRKKILRQAKHITATSNFLAEKTRQFTSKKISIVPFGVDTDFFCPAQKNSENIISIGFSKYLKHIYGADYLLRAMKIVLETFPQARLKIAGSGGEMSKLKKLSTDLGIEQKVHFLGWLSPDQLKSMLQTLTLFVMPSLREAFGVAALEAQACGIPVVASNIDGIPEVVINKKTGILVPPHDSTALANGIIALLQKNDLRKDMGAAGRNFVKQNYSWTNSVKQMIELYKQSSNDDSATDKLSSSNL